MWSLELTGRLQTKPTMVHEDQNALLQRYLSERDPTVAQACLEGLLSEYVEPVVRDITRYKSRLNSSHEAQDEEDIRSEVVLQLIWRLQDLQAYGPLSRISAAMSQPRRTTHVTSTCE
jgi:hypothetical protein